MKKSMLFLLFFVFALSLAITLTINFPGLLKINLFFQSDINFQNWSRSQVNQDFKNLMGYLNNPFQKELVFDNLYVSDRGINHFKDVKFLFQLNYSLLLSTSSVLLYLNRKKLVTRDQVREITSLIKWMIISVCVMALLFFDKAFVLFHQVFFDNDDWMFDYRTDPIISFLSETFFFLCFLLIVTISVSTLTTIHHLFNKEERTL